MNSSDILAERSTYGIAIIGCGFSGLGAAIKLKLAGEHDFIILEKASELGGTWRDNTYPGCACDIPSLMYCYSFENNPRWSQSFSPQPEILNYLKHCADKYNVTPHIRFNSKTESVVFDKTTGRWSITDDKENRITARMVISAAGPFNAPLIPNIVGKDTFEGAAFHSMHWDHKYDLTNKKVAVLGTGASAIQFVPQIAPKVKELYVFQRTAPYIVAKPDKEYDDAARKRFKNIPGYQSFWRTFTYWFLEYLGTALYSPNRVRSWRKKMSLDHLEQSISDPELGKVLTPQYEYGCKRVLQSNDFYPTLERENVELIPEAVSRISEGEVHTASGISKSVDCIIYGTGFYAAEFPEMFTLIGSNDQNLFEKFNNEGSEAYLGITVSGYPNLALMVGPNTGLGHNSIIHMMESQYAYIIDYWKKLNKTKDDRAYFDIKLGVQKEFNREIQEKLAPMVWSSGGCSSYYLRGRNGKNTSIWPGSTVAFRKRTKRMNKSDYQEIVSPFIRKKEPQVSVEA